MTEGWIWIPLANIYARRSGEFWVYMRPTTGQHIERRPTRKLEIRREAAKVECGGVALEAWRWGEGDPAA